MNIYCMDEAGSACSLLNAVQIRTTFHSYPRHAPYWHGPPERGSFYLRALSRAPRPRACPHMLRVHNAALLAVCSNKSISIEWCIFPFKTLPFMEVAKAWSCFCIPSEMKLKVSFIGFGGLGVACCL